MSDAAELDDERPRMGRPSEYKPEYCEQARKLCAGGFTIQQVADFLDVERSTIYYWAAHYGEFSDALKIGKDRATERVEESLYHRAVGYSHPEEKLFCHEGEVIRASTVKHYPPDTGAMVWWLKNQKPSEWRERNGEHDASSAVLSLIEFAKEYARRIGPEAAKRFLSDHGYTREVIEGQLEPVRTTEQDPET